MSHHCPCPRELTGQWERRITGSRSNVCREMCDEGTEVMQEGMVFSPWVGKGDAVRGNSMCKGLRHEPALWVCRESSPC